MPNGEANHPLEKVTVLLTTTSVALVVERQLKLCMYESIHYI